MGLKLFSSSSDLIKSIRSGYVLFLLTNLAALFLTPFILKYVTKSEFGFYILCVELFSWLGFVNLGTAKVLGPKVAKALEIDQQKEIIYLFNSSFWFQLAVSFLTVPLYYGIVIWSGAEKSDVPGYQGFILLFAIAAFIQNMSGQFSEMIIASKKIHFDNRIQLLTLVLRIIIILVFLPWLGLELIFYVYLLVSFFNILRKYWRVNKLYPKLKIKFRLFSKAHFNDLLSDGVFFTLSSLAAIMISRFDQFFLGSQFDLELVTKFYVTIKLIQVVEKFVNILFNNFRPHISAIHGAKQTSKLESLYIELNVLMIGIIGLCYIMLVLANKTFVSLWVGEDFFIGNSFSNLFIFYYLINLSTLPSRMMLVSTLNYIKQLTISSLIQGGIRIAILYSLFNIVGILVLPISSIISATLVGLGYQLLLTNRLFSDSHVITTLNGLLFSVVALAGILLVFNLGSWISIIVIAVGFYILSRKVNFNDSVVVKLLSN